MTRLLSNYMLLICMYFLKYIILENEVDDGIFEWFFVTINRLKNYNFLFCVVDAKDMGSIRINQF